MEIQRSGEHGHGAHRRIENVSSSTSSLSREPSDESSTVSALLDAWEAELEASEERQRARMAQQSSGASASTSSCGGNHGPTGSNSVIGSGAACSGSFPNVSGGGVNNSVDNAASTLNSLADCNQPGFTALEANTPRRSTLASPQPTRSPKRGPPRKVPLSTSGSFASLSYSARKPSSRPTSATQGLRRAAFIAGSVSALQRKPSTSPSLGRDILLPRLPAPALDLIVPALPPATRAALRCVCKALRNLVDTHTHVLTLRPDRRVADELNRRKTKAFELFPALRRAIVVLAGSCSGPAGPSSFAASASGPLPGAGSAGVRTRRSSNSCAKAEAKAAAAEPAPQLPLNGWLVVCGVAYCLTSLTMHLGDIALVEDLALSMTHPNLQRLELFVGRTGSPHGSPPLIQFMIGMFPGLRCFSMTWTGGPEGAGSAAATGAASLASLSHGPRRLFLDGRPRLGPLLLGAMVTLSQLESLELRGFLIDTEGHAILTRHWPRLVGRLQRLVLSKLHLMVPSTAPPDMQLGDLLGACTRLQELHADICLPAASGAAGLAAAAGPGGGAAAAALLIRLMYASRDVRTIRSEMLPIFLTRLSLPGVCLIEPDELEPLSRLRHLTSLELTALGPKAGGYLPALQELRLIDCFWQQLLDMLPWHQQPTCSPPGAAKHPRLAAMGWQEGQREHDRARADGLEVGARDADPAGLPANGGASAAAGVAGGAGAGAAPAAAAGGGPGASGLRAAAAGKNGRSGGFRQVGVSELSECIQLKVLEVLFCERLDDWEASDRGLLARVGKALVPLVDGGCRVRLKVAQDAQPNIWNESDEDGKPWEPAAVWRHIRAAQNLHRLQAETKALAERLARGRQLQAARRKERDVSFRER